MGNDERVVVNIDNNNDDDSNTEKQNFTPGFMRHLERECIRIQGAKRITPEATKLLQTIQVIQIRIIEELGKDLGEVAIVLNQLLGYDNVNERYAVLEAGLMVRGIDFARELLKVTEDALDGFKEINTKSAVS